MRAVENFAVKTAERTLYLFLFRFCEKKMLWASIHALTHPCTPPRRGLLEIPSWEGIKGWVGWKFHSLLSSYHYVNVFVSYCLVRNLSAQGATHRDCRYDPDVFGMAVATLENEIVPRGTIFLLPFYNPENFQA